MSANAFENNQIESDHYGKPFIMPFHVACYLHFPDVMDKVVSLTLGKFCAHQLFGSYY